MLKLGQDPAYPLTDADGLDYSFEIGSSSTTSQRGSGSAGFTMYGGPGMWLPNENTAWFQFRTNDALTFAQTDTSSFNYSFGYGDSGFTGDNESTVTSEGSIAAISESVNHSILLDGSEEFSTATITDSFKYDATSIDGEAPTGSITTTHAENYEGYGPMAVSFVDTTTTGLPAPDDNDPARSPESILTEYRDRAEQVARLKATIADPDTDPGMRDYYQDLLDEQNNSLSELTTEALDAGIPQSELDQIDAEASASASNSSNNEPEIGFANGLQTGLKGIGNSASDKAWGLINFGYSLTPWYPVVKTFVPNLIPEENPLPKIEVDPNTDLGYEGSYIASTIGLTAAEIALTLKFTAPKVPATLKEVGLPARINAAGGRGLAEEGTFFGWKGGHVTRQASDFTKDELIKRGWTKEVLESVAAGYEHIARITPANPSAAGRAAQLRKILETLF